MKKTSFFYLFLLFILILLPLNYSYSETIIFSSCDNKKDGFLKNEYIIDLEKSLMTRNYIYNEKTYKKYRTTDLSVKKENTIERYIYTEKKFILTDKIGYPQFYTQLLFKMNSPIIKLRTVINNEKGVSKISICKKVEIFDKES